MQQLYPDQAQAKRDYYAAIRAGHRAPIIVANTGFGKTMVAASIVRDVVSRDHRALFIVDREELLNQAKERFDGFGLDCGVIMGDRRTALDRHVQIASIDTLVRRDLSALGKFRLLIPDECHLTCSNRYRKVLKHFHESLLCGLSATPERLDGQGLGIGHGGHFDFLVNTPSKAELITMGRLPRYSYYAPDEVSTQGLRTEMGDYEKHAAAERVDQPKLIGSIADHYERLGQGCPAMFFAANIQHAEHIAAEIRSRGRQCIAVSGKSPREVRRDAPGDLASGKLNAVVNVALWVQGFDCPPVRYIGLCALTQSRAKWQQELGRADRVFPGKDEYIIADHAQCWAAHGSPAAPYEWSLEGRKKKPVSEDAFAVRRCPTCYAVIERSKGKCHCGHKFAELVKARTITVGDGELRKVDDADAAQAEAAKQARIAQGMARSRDALIAMGNSAARADYILAARQEKQELRRELAALRRAHGLQLKGIDDLKPKALRAEIASLKEGVAA